VDPTDLTSLVDRCRAGDAPAWEAFVRQIQGRIFALAYSYAGDREDARDLAQEIFVRLYEARSQWPSGEEFQPWLFRVARNRSVDYLRRRSVRRPAGTVDEEAIAAQRAADPNVDHENPIEELFEDQLNCADMVILKAARAQAAFEGRTKINDHDIALAAELALPHRIKRTPFQQAEMTTEQLQERIEQLAGQSVPSEADEESEAQQGQPEEKKT